MFGTGSYKWLLVCQGARLPLTVPMALESDGWAQQGRNDMSIQQIVVLVFSNKVTRQTTTPASLIARIMLIASLTATAAASEVTATQIVSEPSKLDLICCCCPFCSSIHLTEIHRISVGLQK